MTVMPSLSGFIERLGELDDVLTELSKGGDIAETGSGQSETTEEVVLKFDMVDIVTPAGQCLAKALEVEVTPRSPLMVPARMPWARHRSYVRIRRMRISEKCSIKQ